MTATGSHYYFKFAARSTTGSQRHAEYGATQKFDSNLIRPTGAFPSQGKAYAYKNALRRKAGGRMGYEIQGFPTGMSVFSRMA